MEELRTVTDSTSMLQISTWLTKLYKKVCLDQLRNIPVSNIKEIDFLKSCVLSDYPQLSCMSCQTLLKLINTDILDSSAMFLFFISLIPNSSSVQQTLICDAITNILIITLKTHKPSMTPDEEVAQFSLPPNPKPHPLITLIQTKGLDMNDVSNKINLICSLDDPEIKTRMTEYLRPVFFFLLCNPEMTPFIKGSWGSLTSLAKTQPEARELMKEVILWTATHPGKASLMTSLILEEATKHYIDTRDLDQLVKIALYQLVVIKGLVHQGYNPQGCLQNSVYILDLIRGKTRNYANVFLILCAEYMHVLAPVYLPDVLRIMAHFIVDQNCGNQYVLNMCLDGIIQWMAQSAFIPGDGIVLAFQIAAHIVPTSRVLRSSRGRRRYRKFVQLELSKDIRNVHPHLALAYDLAELVQQFEESEFKEVFTFVDAINVKVKRTFCKIPMIILLMRGLFLSREPSTDCWYKIYQIIFDMMKECPSIAHDFLMSYIFKLGSEKNSEIQMELLKGLPKFAVCKDNIPMILNTLSTLTGKCPAISLDLYLRLWRVERHYEIAKANAVREICVENPTQYGPELIKHISTTLNNCTGEDGDLPTSLAINSILSLCNSQITNVISTWKVVSGKFRQETRPLSVKAIFEFISAIPKLRAPTVEYDNFVDEVLEFTWHTICNSPNINAANHAARTLGYFDIGTFLNLRNIPKQFQEKLPTTVQINRATGREVINLQSQNVPGEVWIQVLKKTRPEIHEAIGDALAHFVQKEIIQFRAGVYRLTEGRPEPLKMPFLSSSSVIRPIINYLINNSQFTEPFADSSVATYALRGISKIYPKPLPPVDWNFIVPYFHLNSEARKYALLTLKNQLLHSPTARRIMNNYIAKFEPNCFEEDLLVLFTMLPELSNAINVQTMKIFCEKIAIYSFNVSQANDFAEGCLFEKFLEHAKFMFIGRCEVPDIVDSFSLIIERYIDDVDVESKVFQRYTEVIATLPMNVIDNLTLPTNWPDKPVTKIKKATIIRCYLALWNHEINTPLEWMDAVIEAYSDLPRERAFLYRHLSATLHAYPNELIACGWLIGMMHKIQELLTKASEKATNSTDQAIWQKSRFMLEVFILCVDVLSGCAIVYGNLDVVVNSPERRRDIFPESLYFLTEDINYKPQEAKFYEFIYNLYRHPNIPVDYLTVFKNAIMCGKNKPYCEPKTIWTRFSTMRRD